LSGKPEIPAKLKMARGGRGICLGPIIIRNREVYKNRGKKKWNPQTTTEEDKGSPVLNDSLLSKDSGKKIFIQKVAIDF